MEQQEKRSLRLRIISVTEKGIMNIMLMLILALLLCASCNNKWEQYGVNGSEGWPSTITNGSESFVFNYLDNTAIHYFDIDNAEKIWFKEFKNPKKDALKLRHVLKTQLYMKDGWKYSDSIDGDTGWPLVISKGSERFVFNYEKNIAIHYFNDSNAEKLFLSSFSDPQSDVLEQRNVISKIEYFIVDGWQRKYMNNNSDTILSISKGKEKYLFDYQNNTVLHYFDSSNAEELRFSSFDNPQQDVLEKRNLVQERRTLIDGWQLEGCFGKNNWPLTMKKDGYVYSFDYRNNAVTVTLNNRRWSKSWFESFTDPPIDALQMRNVIFTRKNGEKGWSYDGSYGKYEYPTSMSSGNELYEFNYRNGFLAYHFVNGRRIEAIELDSFASPMDFINNRSRANIKEYIYDNRGVLSYERYLSRGDGNCYFDVYLFDNGSDNYNGTKGIYKKGTGYVDDKIVAINKEYVSPGFF